MIDAWPLDVRFSVCSPARLSRPGVLRGVAKVERSHSTFSRSSTRARSKLSRSPSHPVAHASCARRGARAVRIQLATHGRRELPGLPRRSPKTRSGTRRAFHGVTLSPDARRTLVGEYERLAPWPDAPSALQAMKSAGLRLAPLSNFTATTIETLLANAGLRPMFDDVISTDAAKTFKPDPRAYALGPSVLGLPREQIAFAAFGGWDAAGAKWFGYPTFWVNRLGVPAEELPPGPDAVGPTLTELAEWVGAR